MRHFLPILALAALVLGSGTAFAGGTGYLSSYRSGCCAESKFQTPRYNQTLPYRHYEDHRRYNAAPCRGEAPTAHPYLLKTVVVRKKRVPHYYHDSRGKRHCRKVLTIVYKDIYSDGSCRVWTKAG